MLYLGLPIGAMVVIRALHGREALFLMMLTVIVSDTAQGNGLGVLARCAEKLIALTGTLMGGYADDLFNIFYRREPRRMVAAGHLGRKSGRGFFTYEGGRMFGA